jgi:hypothetical protein
MRVGRNFDYLGADLVSTCALVIYVTSRPEDGHPFVAAGWSGILGGWTLVNRHGLVIANHLGGGLETNPEGIPTLVLTRLLAQKCATIEEALDTLHGLPRMRGQIIWMAQPASDTANRPARAVAVEYDARAVYVREAEEGLLIVGNQNLVFGGRPLSDTPSSPASIHGELHTAIDAGSHDGQRIITATGRLNTLHSVEIDFAEERLFVAHGRWPAQSGPYVSHPLP